MNFTAGLCNAFDISFSNEPYSFPLGLWDYVKWLEKTHGVGWDDVKIMTSCSAFWKGLPLLPNAKEFFDTLKLHFDIQFLTSPTGNFDTVFNGKRMWLEKHGFAVSGDESLVLMPLGVSKESYATSLLFLIDDKDKNVQEFRHGGGYAVLSPRPWNNRHREFESFEQANNLVLTELLEKI